MDKTPGKSNPMMPSAATDPLEKVQGKRGPAHMSDTKELHGEMHKEETDVSEPGEVVGSADPMHHVNTGIKADSEVERELREMARNKESE